MTDPKNNPPTEDKKAKQVKARVLSDGAAGAIDTIVSADAEQIKSWEKEGIVDANPAAVAHVEKTQRAARTAAADIDAPLE